MASTLATKYAEERSKRLRSDASDQYADVRSAEFSDLGLDPWIDYEALANEEPALKNGDRVKFLITGAGHSGLLYAHRLIEAGFKSDDICLIDNAGGYGGTWYWNRYPGLQCDVESYVYLPLLEETGYMPKHKYSRGKEIREHAERIAAHNKLRALFGTKVDVQEWDEANGEWVVKMTRDLGPKRGTANITARAQFVLVAGGVFPTPKVPILPGFAEFRSRKQVFHTSRWDYKITGGTQDDPALVNLKDKVVGIIGTGATAIQVVPILAKYAKHLYVFQRTPSYCGPRGQKVTDPETWSQVANKKGWQYARQRNFNSFLTNDPELVNLVNDGWTEQRALSGITGNPKFVSPDKIEEHLSAMFELDVPRAEKVRRRVDEVVKDPAVAEKLKAWYPGWCKRPTFHDGYLESFNQPNVTLVDTNGKGVERYTKDGIMANGVEYALDLLVLSTGFTVKLIATAPSARASMKVIGRDGRELQDKWSSNDYATLFGVATNQFPNLFLNGFSGGATSLNLTSVFDVNAKLAAYMIAEATRKAQGSDKVIVEVTKEEEDKFTAEVKNKSAWFSVLPTCTPGYFTEEGAVTKLKSLEEQERVGKFTTWGGGPIDFAQIIEGYKSKGDMKGVQVRT
ncbi:hypothetical protein G7Y89_g5204 [Cudoniella acicularis]|uniref:Uncharacterized protein n=1 Tax=Cudoniella acicularis TaxID=354080 RepID=A0A8H4RPF8_9HELO|nr:hypothetical protein G7Y89_g5204 [Cudoniella acicularis]